ncbi:Eco57I restriction-modification methylase domain-containing protein [Clostridium grantii]|uniref:site-specific DNA-methyltransferase (adenine-specific) n=1 Tax=Clostridium grantii DSM 8605 TaxID=1121316 RepID=A0A1M5SLF9_9CLOT|nr:TaqI-like C-terminal specificity domain-containing protein [Clostridium grantii]SHH39361.1 adenine-specific DNA-methyltransferase [Clostridium grantii DSM 8605]
MELNFKKVINELYCIIKEPMDISFKYIAIDNYKKALDIKESSFSQYYIKVLKDRKNKGVVYTPKPIADYMIKNLVDKKEIINNPFLKILDPSCGCGNIIIPTIEYLLEIYLENLDLINTKNDLKLTKYSIIEHILTNNVYGYDIDEYSIKILIIDIFQLYGVLNLGNFKVTDFLIDDIDIRFDFIIGNPPYIGHKTIEREYFNLLKNKYGSIYRDKSDISYCFFQKGLKVINKMGKITFITSRYFMESLSGSDLRKILKEYCSIYRIIDFYGIRPFKNIGIDPVIIFFVNSSDAVEYINVIKPKINVGSKNINFYNSVFLNEGKEYNEFTINKNLLNNKGWMLKDEKEREIIRKIEEKSITNLANICYSYQGIISGLDKAFVVDEEIIKDNKLEKDIIMPWIKSTSIEKNKVNSTGKYIIYTDKIEDKSLYPNCLKYIAQHKEKLMNRRECKFGKRKWYELQWGRKEFIFQEEKIVFPYKSKNNRFSLDKGKCFSADVYALSLKEDVAINYDYLLFLLNSKVYEFYFKCFTKKLGEDMYEYYPNNLMKLCIPINEFSDFSDENDLNQFFGFGDEEIEIINNSI